jgi:hypothetical protein
MQIMSDTPGYCAQLEVQVNAAMASTAAPAEVRSLAEAGHRMCHDGEIRAGIARLRRAIVSLHSVQGSTANPSPPR